MSGSTVLRALRTRRQAMTEDLAALVAVESPATDAAATAASATAVTELGSRLLAAAPQRVGDHLVWSHGPTRVLLVGHHDTVWPTGTLARWPFAVDGHRATGPGCFDMKAGLVQLFHGLSVLPALDGVTVVVNADEEIGSPSSRDLIRDAARGARAALVCEPSVDGALKIARKGIARFRLEILGQAAHAGLDPANGANAAVEMAHQILAVAGLGDAETTVTPTLLAAGSSANTVPATAELTIDVRSFDPAEFHRVERSLRRLPAALPGTRLVLRGGVHRPPLPLFATAALFRTARQVASELGLRWHGGVAVGGASDGNTTAAAGVDTLDGLGPIGGNAHAEGEWVDLATIGDRAALLATLVARISARDFSELSTESRS